MFEAVASNDKNNVVFVKVDVDQNGDISQAYGIRSIPTVIYFKNAKEANRTTGLLSEEAFADAVTNNLK
jgi:thioredoxin 1